ncbi:MrcB family domain-containing protein, partial [Paracoccus aerius]
MRDTLRRICELQPYYSSKNTPEMQERGRLVRQVLTEDIRALRVLLSAALGEFGHDILVEGSDGIGRKTELAWTRFCSEEMSPRPTDGFYVVLHFSTDGSGVNIAVGCSSSKFHNGYSVVLPPNELDNRCEWARRVVLEDRGSLEPFTDPSDFGARAKLPQSFERASALVKKVAYADIEDDVMERHLIEAAEMLRAIYAAQRQGRELSPADQTELEI